MLLVTYFENLLSIANTILNFKNNVQAKHPSADAVTQSGHKSDTTASNICYANNRRPMIKEGAHGLKTNQTNGGLPVLRVLTSGISAYR